MIGDLIAELVVRPVLEGLCYGTGKVIVRTLSLGKLHVSQTARADGKGKKKRSRGSWTFEQGGRRYLLAQGASLVGAAFWAVVVVVAVAAVGGG